MGQTTFDVPAGKVDGDVGVLNTKVGDLSSLTTTAKTNLVSAVNEIDSDVGVLSGKITTLTDKTNAKRYYAEFVANTTNTSWSWGSAYLQKIGSLCVLPIGVGLRSASNDWVNVGTISSSDNRPDYEMRSICATDDGTATRVLRITSDGKIDIYKPTASVYWATIIWIHGITN